MEHVADLVLAVADWITLHITVFVLLGGGLFLTVITRGVQVRQFGHMWKVAMSARSGAKGGISSFQAFTISLAARVGVGNVFGVAAALLMGGPGAVFWMWIVALIGMATSFTESTLAQIFKVKSDDNTYRGGPAYYMSLGLKKPILGKIFAVIAILTCGFVITSVQSNAVSGVFDYHMHLSGTTSAIILFVLAAPIILGGIKAVARVTEIMAPVMALLYVLIAVIILAINITEVPAMLGVIFSSAFNGAALGGGAAGGILAAIINGTKRGLFSNEAGQGTAPNAAATATVSHPVHQGLIQSLGVFIDTIIVCTATAVIILLAGPEVWNADNVNPGTLTTVAVQHHLGDAWAIPMGLIIGVLAFSSIIAAYVYSEVNMSYITNSKVAIMGVRILSVFSVVLGAVLSLDLVWNSVDIAMAVMTVFNVITILFLWKWVAGALRDYEQQRKAGVAIPVFHSAGNTLLPRPLTTGVWDEDDSVKS